MAALNHDRDISANTNVLDRSCPITSVITIAERLKSAREAAGLRQDELAKKAGVTQGTIANIEGGIRKNPRELLAIARAVGVNAEWLKSGKGSRLADADIRGHAIQDVQADYLPPRGIKNDIAHHVTQIGTLLSGIDDVRRAAIAEMLAAVARKPDQAEEIGAHIQALVGSKAKRAA
ncbi:helix-turn-helix domain-containing protein [Acidovorax sp. LjRoot74]|uniref:helix-turn-helix domain-containing protein n=1 Tax=Acidovorax sp. LjRoot74 TaxID=3342337 RepID=UPI003ED0B002